MEQPDEPRRQVLQKRQEQAHVAHKQAGVSVPAPRGSLPRPRARWALATSLAVAWIHVASNPISSPLQPGISSSSSGGGGGDGGSIPFSKRNAKKCSNLNTSVKAANRTAVTGRVPFHSQSTLATSARRSQISRGFASSSKDALPTDTSAALPESVSQSQGEASKQDSDTRWTSRQNRQEQANQAAELSNAQDINTLMRHPALLDNIKAPRHPIVLCHGLYGFDVRGPFWGLEIHYWATVLDILRKKVGAEVIVCGVPGTGAIADRAQALHSFLASPEAGVRGKPLNFIGHSMGGLDARYLISVIKPAPEEYLPVSLTTLNAPHRGSPFMDWCNANVGTGNDRVEAEIREARAHHRALGTHERKELATDLGRQAEDATHGPKGGEKEDFSDHVVEKPPFSLKTPIFVRPTQTKKYKSKDIEGAEGIVEESAAGATSELAKEATSAPFTEGDARKRKRKSSSLFDFSAFTGALSSIGGFFSSYMLSILDQPAYAMLSTRYMAHVFNPTVPNSRDVAYFSVASRKRSLPIYHPLWLPKLILDAAAESRSLGGERDGSADALGGRLQGNDGLVSVESAKWGTFIGVVDGCDHWDLRGGGAPRWASKAAQSTANKGVAAVAAAASESDAGRHDSSKEAKNSRGKKESSWIDINRIIGSLLSKRDGVTESNKVAKTDASVEGSKNDVNDRRAQEEKNIKDDGKPGLVDEVATWISDRLPERDTERHAAAERAADDDYTEQWQLWTKKVQQQASDSRSGSPGSTAAASFVQSTGKDSSSVSSSVSTPQSPPTTPTQHAHTPSPDELAAMRLRVKLRRDAAWEEELGHDDRARELRRELAWHRAEWDRAAASGASGKQQSEGVAAASRYPGRRELDWDAHMKHRNRDARLQSSASQSQSPHVKTADDLERFWIALCRHLWSHGY